MASKGGGKWSSGLQRINTVLKELLTILSTHLVSYEYII